MSSLNGAGRRAEPSEAQMERWSSAFRSTLAETRAAKRRRRIRAVGVAASVLIAATLLVVYRPFQDPPPALIADVSVVLGAGQLLRPNEAERPLQTGDPLLVGDRLRTDDHGGVGLTFQRTDVRLGAATEVLLHPGGIELLRGMVYVDTGSPEHPQTSFAIMTRLGSVSHVGTRYLVALDDGQLVSAVREGRIVVVTGTERRLELASDGRGTELVRVRHDGSVTREQTALHDDLWKWVSALSTGIVVAGRSPQEVLIWVARETGRTVHYADDQAAAIAAADRLSGSSVRLSAEQALRVVSTSTRLAVETSEAGTLSVALDSEDEKNSH